APHDEAERDLKVAVCSRFTRARNLDSGALRASERGLTGGARLLRRFGSVRFDVGHGCRRTDVAHVVEVRIVRGDGLSNVTEAAEAIERHHASVDDDRSVEIRETLEPVEAPQVGIAHDGNSARRPEPSKPLDALERRVRRHDYVADRAKTFESVEVLDLR